MTMEKSLKMSSYSLPPTRKIPNQMDKDTFRIYLHGVTQQYYELALKASPITVSKVIQTHELINNLQNRLIDIIYG